uniref:Uncharacterized protein n=1 Tax=Arundo donax TaxID=35708 RepID=A0A0A9GMK0_ARUDO
MHALDSQHPFKKQADCCKFQRADSALKNK